VIDAMQKLSAHNYSAFSPRNLTFSRSVVDQFLKRKDPGANSSGISVIIHAWINLPLYCVKNRAKDDN